MRDYSGEPMLRVRVIPLVIALALTAVTVGAALWFSGGLSIWMPHLPPPWLRFISISVPVLTSLLLALSSCTRQRRKAPRDEG